MEEGKSDGEVSMEATDLRFVGPATAAVIEAAPFEAADIRDRSVSYADLRDAGVNPGVAAKLRREYSLVWSFDWVAGADLIRRAANVGGLDPDQREWIASSPLTESEAREIVSVAEQAWRERSQWVDDAPAACERCGDRLVTLQMGESRTVHCEACGFVGVAVRS